MKGWDLFTYGFLTVVTMKSIMFQDLRSCSLAKVYLRENDACLLAQLTLQIRRWRQYVPPKRRYPSTRLHSVISRKQYSTFHLIFPLHYIQGSVTAVTINVHHICTFVACLTVLTVSLIILH
jgi:hypothetical protein